MSAVRLTIVGAGSLRCSPAVIGALASFFGERPLEITMYDADEERLDLFDRFARLCFLATRNQHALRSTSNLAEALNDPQKVILQLGENCSRKMLGRPAGPALPDALLKVRSLLPSGVEVLDLPKENWPPAVQPEDRIVVAFQILRYLLHEDYLYEVIREGRQSRLLAWLDLPVLASD